MFTNPWDLLQNIGNSQFAIVLDRVGEQDTPKALEHRASDNTLTTLRYSCVASCSYRAGPATRPYTDSSQPAIASQ